MNHISIKMDPKGNKPETNAITRRCLYQGCFGTNPGIAWTRQGHDALGLHKHQEEQQQQHHQQQQQQEQQKRSGQPTISSPLPTTAVATKERSFYLMCLPNNVPPMVKGTATNNHNKTKEIAAVVGMEWEP
jgi:transcription initiation factor TFIID subunit TAF12